MKNSLKENWENWLYLGGILFLLLVGIVTVWLVVAPPNMDTSGAKRRGAVVLVGGGGERIYLRLGTIFAFTDNPSKEFNFVYNTLHVTSDRFKKMLVFDTPEEAEVAGYKPSEKFARYYTCFKEGKGLLECFRALPEEKEIQEEELNPKTF